MNIIGITGSFGTGKTTVSNFFKELGAVILDADKIAHRAINKKGVTYKKVVRTFGKRILRKDKKIDRRILGKVVFENKMLLRRLCNMIHPVVIKEMREEAKKIKRKRPDAVVVMNVPLLIESGMAGSVDKIIVVKTDQKTQIERCVKKTGLRKEEVLKRIRAQMPINQKIRFADFVIDNSKTKKDTKREVKKIWEKVR